MSRTPGADHEDLTGERMLKKLNQFALEDQSKFTINVSHLSNKVLVSNSSKSKDLTVLDYQADSSDSESDKMFGNEESNNKNSVMGPFLQEKSSYMSPEIEDLENLQLYSSREMTARTDSSMYAET